MEVWASNPASLLQVISVKNKNYAEILREVNIGTSLLVQQLGCHAPTAGSAVQSLVGELRSCIKEFFKKIFNRGQHSKERK